MMSRNTFPEPQPDSASYVYPYICLSVGVSVILTEFFFFFFYLYFFLRLSSKKLTVLKAGFHVFHVLEPLKFWFFLNITISRFGFTIFSDLFGFRWVGFTTKTMIRKSLYTYFFYIVKLRTIFEYQNFAYRLYLNFFKCANNTTDALQWIY